MKLSSIPAAVTQKVQQHQQARQQAKLLQTVSDVCKIEHLKTRPQQEVKEVIMRDSLTNTFKLIGESIKSKISSLKK